MYGLSKYLKPFRCQLIIGPLFKLTEAVFELIIPLVVARVIDSGISAHDSEFILRSGALMVLLGVTGLFCALICQYVASRASQGFGTLLRAGLFSHISSLSYAELDKIGTPSLITRVTNDINQLQVAVAMTIRLFVRAPFLVIGSIIMALRIDFHIAVIFLIATPLVAICYYAVMQLSGVFFRKMQKLLDGISLVTRENLSGARVIRAFSREKTEDDRFKKANDDFLENSVKAGKLSALLSPVTSLITNLAIIAIVWFGGIRVNIGELSHGQIYALVNYMTQNLIALIALSALVPIYTKAAASAARIHEVFELKSSVTEKADGKTQSVANAPKLEFRDVSFRYGEKGDEAITNLSFAVNQGETIGIIGGTGSGKSTLANLIPRFYDVTSGQILIDGIDLREYTFADLRGRIGLVPQNAELFSGTVRENMRWAREAASDDDINSALKSAQAAEFVDKFRNGLDTEILQGGKNLSGGQRQRLTIARALVRKPEILILDDSACALDFATDAALRRSINSDCIGTTVFLISQRVSTVRSAGRILVLDDGSPVGIGTHAELMKTCEKYREICRSQLSEEEANNK